MLTRQFPLRLVLSLMLLCIVGSIIFLSIKTSDSPNQDRSVSSLGDTEGDFYTSDNVRLHYWYYNRGTPIVTIFLHGGPGGNTSSFRHSGQATRYTNEFGSLLVFDQRGGGESENSASLQTTISFSRFIQDIDELRNFMIPDSNVVIFGRSFGGLLAVRYAASNPANVKGYILASPGQFSSNNALLEEQRAELVATAGEDAIANSVRQERASAKEKMAQISISDPNSEPPPNNESSGVDIGSAFLASGDYYLKSEYPLLVNLADIPTLVEYGAYDTQVPPLSIEAMKPYLPNATFLELPGGHGAAYVHEEEFFAAVQELFNSIR